MEKTDSSQLISKISIPQSSGQSAEFIYPGFIEEHKMSKKHKNPNPKKDSTPTLSKVRGHFDSCEALPNLSFAKSVFLCNSTYNYVICYTWFLALKSCHIQPNANKLHRGKAFLARCRYVNFEFTLSWQADSLLPVAMQTSKKTTFTMQSLLQIVHSQKRSKTFSLKFCSCVPPSCGFIGLVFITNTSLANSLSPKWAA